MKIFGFILVVLELVAMTQGIPGLGEGQAGAAAMAETLGFLLPASSALS